MTCSQARQVKAVMSNSLHEAIKWIRYPEDIQSNRQLNQPSLNKLKQLVTTPFNMPNCCLPRPWPAQPHAHRHTHDMTSEHSAEGLLLKGWRAKEASWYISPVTGWWNLNKNSTTKAPLSAYTILCAWSPKTLGHGYSFYTTSGDTCHINKPTTWRVTTRHQLVNYHLGYIKPSELWNILKPELQYNQ